MAEAGETTLSADIMLGTPQYISPEQARGDKELDAGTDIYSFGVVLYEMVVGRVPFNADTPFSIIHDHIYKPLPLPSRINPRVPASVERVLLKSLAKDRADRYATIEDMVAAFRATVDGKAVPEPAVVVAAAAGSSASAPSAATPEVVRAPGRRRWMWVAAGLAVACLCGLTFLGLASAGNEDRRSAEQTAAAGSVSDTAPTVTSAPSATPEPAGDPRTAPAGAASTRMIRTGT